MGAVHCIICRLEKPPRPGDGEHPIALALGGSWTIDRVCTDCDNKFGMTFDARLSKLTAIEKRRIELRLEGHSGTVPNRLRDALKQPVRVLGSSWRRMKVMMDHAGHVTGTHTIPEAKFAISTLADGSYIVRLPPGSVAIDPKDHDKSDRIIRRKLLEALADKGVTITDDELNRLVAHFVGNLEKVEEPTTVEVPVPVRTGGHLPGLLKIAYEAAWHWLGDSWLDDPVATTINCALHGDEAATVKGHAKEGVLYTYNLHGLNQRDAHVIALHRVRDSNDAAIQIQLFDAVGAGFVVTNDLAAYNPPRKHAVVMDVVRRRHCFISPTTIA